MRGSAVGAGAQQLRRLVRAGRLPCTMRFITAMARALREARETGRPRVEKEVTAALPVRASCRTETC